MTDIVPYMCWVDQGQHVISFHPMDQSQIHKFGSRAEMMAMVLSFVDQGYRVQ